MSSLGDSVNLRIANKSKANRTEGGLIRKKESSSLSFRLEGSWPLSLGRSATYRFVIVLSH